MPPGASAKSRCEMSMLSFSLKVRACSALKTTDTSCGGGEEGGASVEEIK